MGRCTSRQHSLTHHSLRHICWLLVRSIGGFFVMLRRESSSYPHYDLVSKSCPSLTDRFVHAEMLRKFHHSVSYPERKCAVFGRPNSFSDPSLALRQPHEIQICVDGTVFLTTSLLEPRFCCLEWVRNPSPSFLSILR